jgi:two-component system response regulator FimZ (fimbrial Z protein)/two-component system response regulator EvgA
MNKSIIISDDHPILRKGIKLLLMTQLNVSVAQIREAVSCNDLLNELKRAPCTHLILDVIYADGTAIEIAPLIRSLYPHIKILVFTMQVPEVYADAFRQYGINFFLNKSSDEEETVFIMKRFLNNEDHLHIPRYVIPNANPFSTLAPRELEILHYLLNGQKTNEIAQLLNLSNSTVSTFKKRILDKTYTNNVNQVLELAQLHNINY